MYLKKGKYKNWLWYIYVYSPRRQIQRKEIEQIDRGQNLQSNRETLS